jgi:hypothetical protein
MSRTVFEFSLKSEFADRESEIEKIIAAVPGVVEVELQNLDPFFELSVSVDFDGPPDAIRKHKALAKAIKKAGYLTIVGVKTVLTDIYNQDAK